MVWGIQTWDVNGIPNNYGIKPVSVVGMVSLAEGQASGSGHSRCPPGLSSAMWFRLITAAQKLEDKLWHREIPFRFRQPAKSGPAITRLLPVN